MKIGIVGLGYVGLPLAVAFAAAGHDVAGSTPTAAASSASPAARATSRTSPPRSCASSRTASRATDRSGRWRLRGGPDLRADAADRRARARPGLRDRGGRRSPRCSSAGQLVVLESTTYPGTTREELLPRLERVGLAAGEDFLLAYSPERIDPGRTDHTIATTPKVVGGITAGLRRARGASTRRSATRSSTSPPRRRPSCRSCSRTSSARSTSLSSTSSRSSADRLGIDIWEVIDAASTKPFGFMRFDPGPGMGGHCLPVDPFYLAYKAREHDFYTEFVELAGRSTRRSRCSASSRWSGP